MELLLKVLFFVFMLGYAVMEIVNYLDKEKTK